MPPTDRSCERCTFYAAINAQMGECRRYPPTSRSHPPQPPVQDTPSTIHMVACHPKHWCGEFVKSSP